METEERDSKIITIADIADALGVSKTTVSRAISGKGRIGTETRNNVLRYIKEHDYKPNVIARGLAQSKTYNICLTLPSDYNISELPYFQKVLLGACDYLSEMDYDVIVTKISEDDISNLSRIIYNRKVDGVILTRTTMNGKSIKFLKSKKIPFLVLGIYPDESVYQIDSKHMEGCAELTNILLMKGLKRLALFEGSNRHYVTKSRYEGFRRAHEKAGVSISKNLVYENLVNNISIEKSVDDALKNKADCIVCMDDNICYQVLRKLRHDGVNIPGDIRVASFFDSNLLEGNSPPITCVDFEVNNVGLIAAKTLLSIIDNEENVPMKIELGYEIALKESTK